MEYYIYTLSKNNEVFYIGKTNNIKKRLANHKITLNDESVCLEILDKVIDWKFWEQYWINQFKIWGFVLTNKNKGGGGPDFLSSYSKNLISLKLKGRKIKRTSETNNKIGLSHKGLKKTPCSDERKRKISQSNSGKKYNLGKIYQCKNYKKVQQYDLDNNFIKEWNNVYEILNFLNKKPTNMSIFRCCQGKIQQAYGFIWKYK